MEESRYTGISNLEAMEMAVRYNKHIHDFIEKEIKKIEKSVSQPRIVDFGAGSGQFAGLVGKSRKLIAVEPDESLRRMMRKKKIDCVDSLEKIKNESVDLMYSLNVLEHIEDDLDALGKMTEKMKVGGTLLIYVPAFQCLYSSMDRHVGHYRRYRREELVGKIMGAGCQIHEARYVDSLGFPISWLFKMVSKESGEISQKSVKIYDRFIFPISQRLDPALFHAIGKNLLVIASK